jgi:acyl-CoA synthetase (AMP-forming)/AMP-acid ligase II
MVGEDPIHNLGAALLRGDRYDDPALIDLGGRQPPKAYSFRHIDALADAVARGLLARGLRSGQRTAILSANRVEFLASHLGAMRAGLVSVPLNLKQPAETLEHMMRDCDARLVLCDRERVPLVPAAFPRIEFDGDGEHAFDAFWDERPFTAVRLPPRDPAMFLYTSGSSGVPKGVMLSHESHLWVIEARKRMARAVEHVLIAAPLYHMNALGITHGNLVTGNCTVLLPSFDVAAYIEAIARYRVTMLPAITPMIAMMLQRPDLLKDADLSSVRLLRMGSAPVSQKLLDEAQALFPDADVANVYGTTEAGPIAFGPHPQGIAKPRMSVGCPAAGVEMRLVGADGTTGDEGVLEIRCPALMTGYHGQPEATRRVITNDGYFVSGDIFRRDRDGFYFFVGRADDMFVCGGENVYPGEVEKVLERHPGVHQACVVPIADDIKGMKPVAFVVRAAGAHVGEREIKDHALRHAAAYLHPRRVWFLDELPLAGTNKIDKQVLTRLAADRMAEESAPVEGNA